CYVHFSLFLWLSIYSCVGAIGRASPKDVIVPTTGGPLRGLDNGLTQAFRGIPYAAPPVGSL
ncbi:carboxylesterase family protein, partial [Biomphalaria glabrata]